MPESLPEIIYNELNGIPVVDSNNSMYQVPFFKDDEYLDNIESRVNFIKGCEKMVRTNDRYNKYIDYLKNTIGLNHCQVLSNITDDDAPIEMHHGPILTLYDYCDIAIEYFLLKKWKITTYRIADYVLDEHYRNHVQVVMLSETAHEEVHDRSIFIHYNMAFGDLPAFIKKHREAINDTYDEKSDRYIERCTQYDSTDFGVFKLNDALYPKK